MSANKVCSGNKFSLNISDFCNAVSNADKDFKWHYEEVGRLDKLTQDYLHMLELGDLKYAERAKVATQLQQCRRQRRESKDKIEILEPLVTFFQSDQGKSMLRQLQGVLGETRKIEGKMETRTYINRVLKEDDKM